jgi:beta-1,4-galactosyltransferase 1
MKLSIIIPYRDREEHLKVFLEESNGKINVENYDIIVVSQNHEKLFNRGKLLNVGFEYAKNESDYFCFHDIDMIPINVDYSYPEKPYHLAVNMPQGDYDDYYGGVNLFNKEDFLKINGFSNEFWGWGHEDDDLLNRIKSIGYSIFRREGQFKSLPHIRTTLNHDNYQNNFVRCKNNYDFISDGLSTLEYEINSVEKIADNATMLNVSI